MKKYRDLAIFLFISLGLTIIIAGSLFNYYLSPESNSKSAVREKITITDGKNIDKITAMLYNKHLIRNPKVFKIYLKINNINKLKTGSFVISSNMSSVKIVKLLTSDKQ